MITLFTLMFTSNPSPPLMLTVMSVSEVWYHGSNPGCLPRRIHGRRLALDDLVRTSDNTILVPLFTSARLPALAAHIAKLCPAMACHVVAADIQSIHRGPS